MVSRPAALALALAAGCIDAEPCPQPLVACSGVCVDIRSDRLHCGRCGQACGAGLACRAAECVPSPDAACAIRTGGGFVTLEACGQVVKQWVTADPFLLRAEALVADPLSAGARIPVLRLLDGSDCDAQWSWRGDPLQVRFDVARPPVDCDACPRDVETQRSYYVGTVGQWCPTTARVLAVDRR
jgi:hypothetical protein